MRKKIYIKLIINILSVISVIILTNCSSNEGKPIENNTDIAVSKSSDKAQQNNSKTETANPENAVAEKPLELNNKNFKSTIQKGVVVVDFWATWCGPCRMQGPIIDELAKEFGNKVKIGKLNVDANNAIATEYNVKNIPTIIIFKDGKLKQRFVGLQDKAFLKQQIESLL